MDTEKEHQDANSTDHWTHQAPWVGITSIISILFCAAASGAILAVSHGDLVEDWKIKPAVLLAIISTASNIAFSTALATGVAIRFWLHVRRGALLTQLHYIWDHGRGIGLIRALRAGSEARRVAIIATLGYIVQFSAGPLLQRATYQAAQDHFHHDTMYLDISTKIPDGHFGINQNGNVVAGRRAMSQSRAWYHNETITTKLEPGYTCDSGTCKGHVTAAGFTHTCIPLPPHHMAMVDSTTNNQSVFAIQTTRSESPDHTPLLNLTTLYICSVQEGCIATLQQETCQFIPAIVSYPITIQNTTLSLRYLELLSNMPIISTYPTPSPGDSLAAPFGTPTGPSIGLWYFLNIWLTETATKRFSTTVNRTLFHGDGQVADIFFRAEPWDYNPATNPLHQCGLMWDSPTEYAIRAMYDYMFRVALKTGSQAEGGKETKEFAVEKVTSELVFRSDVRYLGAAMVATGCCLGLLMALFWGWWRLGKKVTLSPLETARVFGGVSGRFGGERTIEGILKAARGVEFRVGDGERKRRSGGVDGRRGEDEDVDISGEGEEWSRC